jgi:hypothetical protein
MNENKVGYAYITQADEPKDYGILFIGNDRETAEKNNKYGKVVETTLPHECGGITDPELLDNDKIDNFTIYTNALGYLNGEELDVITFNRGNIGSGDDPIETPEGVRELIMEILD